MNQGRSFLAPIAFLALLGCHGADSSIPKPRMDTSPRATPVMDMDEDMDAEWDEHTRALAQASIVRDMINGLSAGLNELDEGGIIPECEASDYQAMPVAENPGIPSDIRNWIDEGFVAIFLHNLDCYHLAAHAANSPITGFVTISPEGVYVLVTNALRQRFGVERITEEARESARSYLKSPQNLRRLYDAFRPQIIELLRVSRKNHAIKRRLAFLIPFFERSFSDEVIEASRRQSIAHQRCYDAFAAQDESVISICNEEEAAHQELTRLAHDRITVQWILRRRAEGGQALVRAWGEILKDLHRSI